MNLVQEWLGIFVGAGVFFILAELLVPGMVLVFLGISTLLVSGAIYLGWLESWPELAGAWLVASSVLLFSARSWVSRKVAGRTEKSNIDEDVDACGTVVKVVEVDKKARHRGRIVFRGTNWDADALDEELVVGGHARIVSRRNLVWIVEPCGAPAALEASEQDLAEEYGDP